MARMQWGNSLRGVRRMVTMASALMVTGGPLAAQAPQEI